MNRSGRCSLRRRDADLLVVGSRGLHGVRALGSVSERVAHRAPCSVLVVRLPTDAMTSRLLVAGVLVAIGVGGLLHLLSEPAAGNAVWAVATAVVLAPLTWSVGRALLHGDIGVDAIALVAMAASLALGEYLAGVVVGLMLAGGNALEESGAGRARRELKSLDRPGASRRAQAGRRNGRGGSGRGARRSATTSRAARRSRPGGRARHDRRGPSRRVGALGRGAARFLQAGRRPVRSGTANVGEAFELRATRPASESAYAAVVRLVQEAESHRAPFVRMADRYAALFLPVTLDSSRARLDAQRRSGPRPRRPRRRDAVPVDPRRARRHPLRRVARRPSRASSSRAEQRSSSSARHERSILDKTGTLTLGRPEIERVVPSDGIRPDETCCGWRLRSTSSPPTLWRRRS